MSLYRKYRPQTFADVIGQDHITTTITNQIRTGTLSHAYLFCGTRGTGKTTVARLVARAINCTEPALTQRPCNHCDNCQQILRHASPNVIEIDAASNNGVENIRDILEEVKYPPVTGQYKIYVIDEVHMLSIGAFNALLKTLEEPPAHVVFILATTDPHKVPATIHSRCQRYEFRRIATQQLATNIEAILQAEAVSMASDGVWLVATLGDGSARDSLSLLGQALAFYGGGGTITAEQIREMLGMVDSTVLFHMTQALMEHNALAVVTLVHELAQKGRDFTQFTLELLGHLRNLALAKLVHEPGDLLALDQQTFEQTLTQSQALSQSMLQAYIDGLTELSYKIKTEKSQKILLEVTLLKLAHLGEGGLMVAPQAPTLLEPSPPPQVVALPQVMTATPAVVTPTLSPVTTPAPTPAVAVKPPVSPVPQERPAPPTIASASATMSSSQALPTAGEGLTFTAFVEAQPPLLKTLLKGCQITQAQDTVFIQTTTASMVLLKSKEAEIKTGLHSFFGQAFEVMVTDTAEKKTKRASPSVTATQVGRQSEPHSTASPPAVTSSPTPPGLSAEQKQHLQTNIQMPITFV